MTSFAHKRDLGPVHTAFTHIVRLNMYPLTHNANPITQTILNRTQTHLNRTQTLNRAQIHLISDPVSYEEYRQQWDTMAIEVQRGTQEGMHGYGRERGSGPKTRQNSGFKFQTKA